MSKKIILVLIIFMLFIVGAKAEDASLDEIVVSKKSEYLNTIFSYNRVEVDFLDEDDDSFVAGALLKITDKDGNTVVEWESSDETMVIEGLTTGVYYLSEVKAPDKYKQAEDKVKFEVGGDVVMLELSNLKERKLATSLSASMLLMIFMGMFDTALGIGMFVYAKKAKC